MPAGAAWIAARRKAGQRRDRHPEAALARHPPKAQALRAPDPSPERARVVARPERSALRPVHRELVRPPGPPPPVPVLLLAHGLLPVLALFPVPVLAKALEPVQRAQARHASSPQAGSHHPGCAKACQATAWVHLRRLPTARRRDRRRATCRRARRDRSLPRRVRRSRRARPGHQDRPGRPESPPARSPRESRPYLPRGHAEAPAARCRRHRCAAMCAPCRRRAAAYRNKAALRLRCAPGAAPARGGSARRSASRGRSVPAGRPAARAAGFACPAPPRRRRPARGRCLPAPIGAAAPAAAAW